MGRGEVGGRKGKTREGRNFLCLEKKKCIENKSSRPTVCNPANLGGKESRKTQIKKWSIPFWPLLVWISTFVIIFYISLPNLCGCKSKNNKIFFSFLFSLQVKQMITFFFPFLLSSPFPNVCKESVFLYFSPPSFSFTYFFSFLFSQLQPNKVLKQFGFFVNKYRCWAICKRWSFKEFSSPWLAFESLSFLMIFQSPTFIT